MSVAGFKSRPEKKHVLSLPLQSVADNQSINVGTLLKNHVNLVAAAPCAGPALAPAAGVRLAQVRHWGVAQWCAYLQDREIPLTRASRAAIAAVASKSEVAPGFCARILLTDPLLALLALRQAQSCRSQILGNETTSPLASTLLIGMDGLLAISDAAPHCREGEAGLIDCALRGATAAHLAYCWAELYSDKSPDEVALAALLVDFGELLLWQHAPAVCQQLRDGEAAHRRPWSADTQAEVLGFSLRALSIALAEAWHLPPQLIQLMRNPRSSRARIACVAATTAHQLARTADAPAIAATLAALGEQLGVAPPNLLATLPVSSGVRQSLLESVSPRQHDRYKLEAA